MELKDEFRGQLLTCCLASSSLDLKAAAFSFIDAMSSLACCNRALFRIETSL